MSKNIVHISEVDISLEGGMGRVEYHWMKAFENKGFNFIHIGKKEIGDMAHKFLFPYKAYSYYKKLGITADAFIVHEPASGSFVGRGIPCFLESHGIERRYWDISKKDPYVTEKRSLKTKILFPLWRLYSCDKGLRQSKKLLLINNEDSLYARKKYGRSIDDIFIFKNGVNSIIPFYKETDSKFTILFNASWIDRKGKDVLVKAAEILYKKKISLNYLLIGTGKNENVVRSDWPDYLQPFITVIASFIQEQEINYLHESSIFILPSFYEGQPLSLLQAMAAGKCCITTNCCGQKDLIENNKTGLLFTPGSHQELASLIEQCYKNPTAIATIGSEAAKHVSKLSWEKVSNELVDYVISNI